jgi:ribosomal protein S7
LSWVENRILPAVKKNQAASACREAFDLILKKLKTPLSMQEKIQPQLSDSLANQVEAIKLKDEEQMDSELWTTDSLCYLSFNMVQEFRISHQVSYSYL